MNPVRDEHRESEKRSGDQHHGVASKRLEHHTRHPGPENRSQGSSDADHTEEALPFLLGIDVVREGPELRHQHDVEQSHPEVEDDAERHAHLAEQIEDDQIGYEECGYTIDQPESADTAAQHAI